MNLCFLNATEELGGGEIWVLKACREAQAQGHRVSVVCPHRSRLAEECLEAGIDCYLYTTTFGVPFERPLYHRLVSWQTDVLYCTVVGTFLEAAVLSGIVRQINAERRSRRLTLVLKTGLPPIPAAPPEFYGVGHRPAVRRLHVVGDACRESFLGAGWLQDPDFVETWREGIDVDAFRPAAGLRGAARQALGLPDTAPVLVTTSRLVAAKGHAALLHAVKVLVEASPDVQLLIAGDGPERATLQGLAAQLGIAGRTHFLGHVTDTLPVLAAADLFCHPSMQDGIPNSIVEASAMELPIVASRLAGIVEVVGDRARLCEPASAQSLYENLYYALLELPALRDRAAGTRELVCQKFDFKRNFALLLSRVAEEQTELDRESRRRKRQPARPRRAPTKVLFLMTCLRTGGEERELLTLAKYLDRKRFAILVISAFEAPEPAPVLPALYELGIEVDTGAHKLTAIEDKVGHIARVIRAEDVSVLVACQDTSLAYEVMKRLPAGQCKLIEHGGILDEANRIPKDRTHRYAGVSPEIAAHAASMFSDPSRAVYLPSMVDLREYQGRGRGELRRAYGFPGDACIVTFLGRLDSKKGVDVLVRTAAELLPRHPELMFLIVGPPDAAQAAYAEALRQWAEPVTASGRFIFTGVRGDTATLLIASDIFALPARDEGMSHAINEAGAAGLAVVAYDSGAAAEQLDGGSAGILVPQGDEAAFTRAVGELAVNESRRRLLGERLRQHVSQHYAASVVVPAWEKLLSETAASAAASVTAPALVLADEAAPDFPREIQIQTVTYCNATCVMCPYPAVSKEVSMGRMTEELYASIIDQLSTEPGVSRIEPFLMNEPFLDTRMANLVRLAKDRAPHAMVTLTTNGSPVTPRVAGRIATSGLDAIWFSFNGATKSTFESIMGISYDKVRRNLEYLLSIRPPSLQVFVNMVETNEMRPEIEENIRYWTSRGVGAGSSPLVNRAGNVENYVQLNYQPRASKPVRVCEHPYSKMFVLYTGEVVLCCMDWRRSVILGNLNQQTIREIWNGERYRHIRRRLEEGRSDELDLCRTCSYCLH